MGVYLDVHVGPMLICKLKTVETTKIKTIKRSFCPTDRSHKSEGFNFCPICGAKIEKTEETKETKGKKEYPGWNDIDEILDNGGFSSDEFWNCWGGLNCERLIPGCDVLAPNGKAYLGRENKVDKDEFNIHVINPDIQKEIALFEAKYAKEIAFLSTVYESVKVEWMILTTGS